MSKAKDASTEREGAKVVAVNKKARHDYEILDTFEAGIVLLGSEIKSIRGGNVNLKESYVRVLNNELVLIGCHVTPYSYSRLETQEPLRERKLLMHRREIERLSSQLQLKGLTLIPLRLYLKGGRCKIEIGLGKGKKLYDKREDLKKKEANREIERALHSRRR